MTLEPNDRRLDDLIHAAVGKDDVHFDFQEWKRGHRSETEAFACKAEKSQPRITARLAYAGAERKRIMVRTIKISIAAAVFIAVCLGLPHLGRHNPRGTAFAEALKQIDGAKTITWKITFYNKATSKDGLRTWVKTTTREQAYMAPGLYRDVALDENGQTHHWTVTDTIEMRELSVNPGKQQATMRGLAVGTFTPGGPFAWVMDQLKKPDLEWVGTRETATGTVNIFRRSYWSASNNRPWSYDFWIDAQTKQLTAVQIPGADIFDRETDPLIGRPVYADWHSQEPQCSVQYDIRFDADLDESLFSLEPPAGYAIETEGRPTVTEAEMIEYLGVMADYNGQTFPDQPYSIGSPRLNEIYDKAEADRTPAEQRLLDVVDHYKMASLNMMPTGHFIEDHTVRDTFRYLGKGVTLGDQDRIVCWYRVKGATTYRVVYGDLSVKDLPAEALPLPVEP